MRSWVQSSAQHKHTKESNVWECSVGQVECCCGPGMFPEAHRWALAWTALVRYWNHILLSTIASSATAEWH